MVHEPGGPFGPPASIPGIVRFGGEAAQRGYRLNRFLVHISRRENRQAFLDDEAGWMRDWQLSEEEQALVSRRDYDAMLHYGVNVYAIVKAGYVFGHSLLEIGKRMKEPS